MNAHDWVAVVALAASALSLGMSAFAVSLARAAVTRGR